MSIFEKKTYSSPFPHKKSNKSLVEFSRSMILKQDELDKDSKVYKHRNFKTKDKPEKIKVDVTPNNLKNYMYNNTFYYDLKNWKEYNKPTHVRTRVSLKSVEKPLKEPLFIDKKEKTQRKFHDRVNHAYLASIVKESEVSKILTYKDDYNSFDSRERERPILHDYNAFKNRPQSARKTPYSTPYNNTNNIGNSVSQKKVDLKTLLKTTVTKPFHHKNYSEIPDYIRQFKVRDKMEKEYEKLIEEESTYPKGTVLIPEDVRLKVLNELKLIHRHLINLLEKCPVTVNYHSTGVRNRKKTIESRLDEVEKHLDIFNKKKVFLSKA